ncbi:MAG: YceH family protein [Gemmataceae bacterium]
MSPEPVSAWPTFSLNERRVLGVLVEKQKTTDTYPLTVNSVVTGANQKSNREPLMNLADHQVEDALEDLKKKGLVMQVVSGRVDKWRHLLYEAWKVSSVELAALAELLLRGPQTEGELRGRASRMDEIADVDALRAVLKPLVERKLVVYLTPEGRRGTVVTHGFHDPRELERLKSHHANAALDVEPLPASVPAAAPDYGPVESRLAAAESRIAELQSAVARLRAEFGRLAALTGQLQNELGNSAPAEPGA